MKQAKKTPVGKTEVFGLLAMAGSLAAAALLRCAVFVPRFW